MSQAVRALDAALFEPRGWFAIDADNVRVAGVTPGTLDEALRLVGRGQVATIVGRLRPEVIAVDVDLAGDLGLIATDQLTDWCTRHGLWHLVRPSGGGRGRAHVLIVPGVHAAALARLIEDLRADLHAGRSKIDVRSQLRPLSAPHRRGPSPEVAGDVDGLLDGLREVLAPLPRGVVDARRAPVVKIAGPLRPLPARTRRRRDLPGPWAAYLREGRPAAARLGVDRDPSQRSQIELEATFQLVIAGYSEAEAWGAITAAHPSAFPKARSRGRRWWWHTWNRCVVDADAWLTTRATSARRPDTEGGAGTVLRAALAQQWRTWPARTRHYDLEVATTIADLMDRHETAALSLSQRDLLLACAVRSRTTVRASLGRLATAGLIEVEPTYLPGATDSSDTIKSVAVSPNDPPRFQPPHPSPGLPLRHTLGVVGTAVLRGLEMTGRTVAEVAREAGICDVDVEASRTQLRTTRAHLRRLAEIGAAHVDETGLWRRAAGEAVASRVATAAGRLMVERKHEAVAAERRDFRDALDADRRRERWESQRVAAIARSRKAARAAQRQWWSGLSEQERQSRRASLEESFARRGADEQARLKDRWATQRAAAGEDERKRWEEWRAGLSPAELDDRSIDRTLAFAARPGPERAALVAAWASHRSRWNLPMPRRDRGSLEAAAAGPSPSREAEQLELELAVIARRSSGRITSLITRRHV